MVASEQRQQQVAIAAVAVVGVMWLSLLLATYYQAAKLEVQISSLEDAFAQQLQALKQDVRIAATARDEMHADAIQEVRPRVQAASRCSRRR